MLGLELTHTHTHPCFSICLVLPLPHSQSYICFPLLLLLASSVLSRRDPHAAIKSMSWTCNSLCMLLCVQVCLYRLWFTASHWSCKTFLISCCFYLFLLNIANSESFNNLFCHLCEWISESSIITS